MLGLPRDRATRILSLALPIIGGMVSQNVLNLVDTLMVSHLSGEAIAAVGLGGMANFMASAFITGMSAGVQAMSSRRLGQGRTSEMAIPLNGGLVVVAAISIPLSALLVWRAEGLFSLISSDPAVVALGTPYLQARLVAMIAIGSNFAFRGYWNGVNLSRLYLRTLVVMHVCNVFLNFALIFGYFGFPELGAPGAGIGTAISTFIGTGYYFYLGRRYAGEAGFLHGIPGLDTIKKMLRLSVPSGVQQLVFAAGFVALFAIIDRVGTAEVAAANVLLNLTLVAYLPGLGLGLAAASLVGQALGRKDVDDAERWGWDVVKVGVVVMGVLGVPMAVAPELILSAFSSKAPEVLELAALPLRLVGFTIFFEAFGMVLLNATMGAGATTIAMIISAVAQWGVFLPAALIVGPMLGYGLLGIWIANIAYRALSAVVFAGLWRSRRWASVEV